MHCDGDISYYHMIMVYIVGGFAAGVFVILVITWPQKLGYLRKFARKSNCLVVAYLLSFLNIWILNILS